MTHPFEMFPTYIIQIALMALHYNNQLQYRSATCCILIPLQVMVTTGRRRPSSWYPRSAGRENTHMLQTSPTAGQGLGDSGVETANVAFAHTGDRASDSSPSTPNASVAVRHVPHQLHDREGFNGKRTTSVATASWWSLSLC